MRSVNMHEAKTQLSKLVDQAANGQPFVIAKAGKPMVKVVPLEPAEVQPIKRWGFLADRFASGEFVVPEDFKGFMREEIEQMFYGDDPVKVEAAE